MTVICLIVRTYLVTIYHITILRFLLVNIGISNRCLVIHNIFWNIQHISLPFVAVRFIILKKKGEFSIIHGSSHACTYIYEVQLHYKIIYFGINIIILYLYIYYVLNIISFVVTYPPSCMIDCILVHKYFDSKSMI